MLGLKFTKGSTQVLTIFICVFIVKNIFLFLNFYMAGDKIKLLFCLT